MRLDKLSYWLLIIGVLVTPLSWWFADLLDPDTRYCLFFFRPDKCQKLHWYTHLSGLKISIIFCLWALVRISKRAYYSKATVFSLKILFGFATYNLLQYWGFRYELPGMSIILILFVIINYIYFKNGK